MASDKVRIFVKMTPEEKSRIRERMSEAGFKNLSAYVRKMLLNGYVINLDLSDVKEVLRLLRISSNNLKSKFAKTSHASAKLKKSAKAGLLKVTAAKGWKIVYAGLWDAKASKEYQFYSWENPVTSVSLHVPAMKKGREYSAYARFVNSSTGGEIYVNYHLAKK
jgi:hypothetical protein